MADRGIRRLLPDELAKAKGVPPDWISQEWMATRDINTMTSLHLWAAVASSLDVTVAQSVYSTPSIPLEQERVDGSRRR